MTELIPYSDLLTAGSLARALPISMTQMTRLFLELVEVSQGNHITRPDQFMDHCRQVIQLGSQAKIKKEQTISFREALLLTLRSKQDLSSFSLRDIRYYMRRLIKNTPDLEKRDLNTITPSECHQMLLHTFPSASQRKKARANLSGIFSWAIREGLATENPTRHVRIPSVIEKEIKPLLLPEIQRLMKTAQTRKHRRCLPSLIIMLFCGVRPQEMRRLLWEHINLDECELTVPAQHSKTGGSRFIPFSKSLSRFLRYLSPTNSSLPICPKSWDRRWKALRHDAGFTSWTPDILRHTYASYFIKYFHDLKKLQIYMGHRDSYLLRSRYVNLYGISERDAQGFWNMKFRR